MAKMLSMKQQNARTSTEEESNKQLEELLTTNTILLSNKRQICQIKIQTYDKQINKITALLNWPKLNLETNSVKIQPKAGSKGNESDNSDEYQVYQDEEFQPDADQANENEAEKRSLLSRLQLIKSKRQETLLRLQSLTQMENELKEAHHESKSKVKKLENVFEQKNQLQNQDWQKTKLLPKVSLIFKNNSQKNSEQMKCNQNKFEVSTANKQNLKQEWRIKQKQKESRQNFNKSQHIKNQDNGSKPNVLKTNNQKLYKKYKDIDNNLQKSNSNQYNQCALTERGNSGESKVDISEFYQRSPSVKIDKSNSMVRSKSKQKVIKNKQKYEKNHQQKQHECCYHAQQAKDHKQSFKRQQNILQQLVSQLMSQFNMNGKGEFQSNERIQNFNYSNVREQSLTDKSANHIFSSICNDLIRAKQNVKTMVRKYDLKVKQQQQQQQKIEALKEREKQKNLQTDREQRRAKEQQKTIDDLKQKQNQMASELIKIQRECEMYYQKIRVRQQQYESLNEKIKQIEGYKIQIETNLEDLLQMHTRNMKQIESELVHMHRQIVGHSNQNDKEKQFSGKNMSKQKSKNNSKKEVKQLKTESQLEQTNRRVLEIHEQIKTATQAQKSAAFQNKQIMLSLEYQVELLKGEEQRLQNKQTQLLERIEKNSMSISDMEKEKSKLAKDKDKLERQCLRAQQQTEEFENLAAIRKKCYEDLQQKYNHLKNKKSKLDRTVKCLEDDTEQKQARLSKMEESLDRDNRQLLKIKDEIKQSLMEKQQLASSTLKCEQTLNETKLQLKSKQSELGRFSQQLLKQEHRLSQLKNLVDEQNRIHGSTLKSIGEIKERQSTEQAKLSGVMQCIKQKETVLSSLLIQIQEAQAKLEQAKSLVNEARTRINYLQQKQGRLTIQVNKLMATQDELEQGLSELMTSKEEAFNYITRKYEQLEEMEAATQMLSVELQQKQQAHADKLNDIQLLDRRLDDANKELTEVVQKVGIGRLNLERLISSIQSNKDEQINTLARVQMLQKLEQKILLHIALKAYSQPQSNPTERIEDEDILSLISQTEKQQIEIMLGELAEVQNIRMKLEKEKQENRKLKLDNHRLRKMYEVEMDQQVL